ncbi:GyrI-like domain-containing protein [Sphingobacterium sp. LRF_L2]|uniref:GyrI-like domain-containing protein n=1 Tax=Sphingobacterium sp. LRF_L2 TaxID=3369421 RepID=UPI003F628161
MIKQALQEFHIVGISTRTINANGQSAIDIEALWQHFWEQKIQDKIPNKTSGDIYAVYTEYETDFTGEYTTIIGLPVNSLDDVPEGMVGLTIETTVYHKIVSRGKMPEAIGNTWFAIWADRELDSKRAYKADFTIHGQKYDNGAEAEVETYLSVRE